MTQRECDRERGRARETGKATAATGDRVCVVGLGYVGLPLAVALAEAGHDVTGYDVDEEKVARLRDGEDPTGDVGDAVASADVAYTGDPASVADVEYVVVTVPTPVDDFGNPNLAFVEAAGETVGEHMTPGTTVVLESTVYPGATEGALVPALERGSGLTAGEGFHVGYSPERASPGDGSRGVREVVKLVAGDSPAVRDDLARLYGTVVDAGVFPVDDIETAEAAKAIENVQRDINIALVNELAVVCEHMDLETEAVLEAAGTKWNFHDEYRPGLVGGHCIPVDPLYLIHRSEREGFSPKLILQAREINDYMPKHVADVVLRTLNNCGKVLQDSRVLVLGLAYKANVGDIRTSDVAGVVRELQTFNVDVAGFDPHADAAACRAAFDIPIQSTPSFRGFYGVVVATGHDAFASLDLGEMRDELNPDPLVVDVPGVLDPDVVAGNGFTYRRI